MQSILVKFTFTMLDLTNNDFIGLAEELITSRMKAWTYVILIHLCPKQIVHKDVGTKF